jgi:Putative prokaryotic signal transducing protein
MIPGPEDLAAQYAQMSETELMELARSYDSLQEVAQAALRAEFARRGLEPPLVEEPEELVFRRLVTVRRYRDLMEAVLGRSLLDSAGISSWIADENLVRMDWFYSNAVGGMRLQVDENDEAAAREILEEGAPPTITYGEKEAFVQPVCPKCGSVEVAMGDGTEQGRSLVALYVLAIPVPPRKPVWHCEVCGAQWADTEND